LAVQPPPLQNTIFSSISALFSDFCSGFIIGSRERHVKWNLGYWFFPCRQTSFISAQTQKLAPTERVCSAGASFVLAFPSPSPGHPMTGWFSYAYLDFFSLFRRV
jgi:hypothetical protein